MEELRNGVLIDKMLKAEVAAKNTKDYTADAAKIIEELKADNDKSAGADETALAKISSMKAELDATPAEERVEKFKELAKAESECPSGKKGGDLGDFTRGMMVKEFEEVAFAQEIGQISDPVKTRFGYHLILTTGKTPATEAQDDGTPATPEKVSARHILVKVPEAQEVPEIDQVVKFIKAQDERRLVSDYILKIVRAAKIETSSDFSHLLPPPEMPEEEDEAPAPEAPAPAPEAQAEIPAEPVATPAE